MNSRHGDYKQGFKPCSVLALYRARGSQKLNITYGGSKDAETDTGNSSRSEKWCSP